MDLPFHSDESSKVNKYIFETIYHGALEMSNELAISRQSQMIHVHRCVEDYIHSLPNGIVPYDDKCTISEDEWLNLIPLKEELVNNLVGSYSSFSHSPASEGILQFDMWDVKPSDRYDWDKLKTSIKHNGIRNSLLLAPMPTASTSQILGNNECFEPFTSNIYSRRTLAGEFMIVNKHLQKELIDLNIWNEEIKNKIIENKGSISNIDIIPDKIKEKYKIVWEIPMKCVIDMSSDRGAFICQSQSLNLWMENPSYKTLTSMHFYGWEKGLKTGMYYLRRKAKHQAQQFTIEPGSNGTTESEECEVCSS
jgi:ribonucleotide reductase alpha subunit